MSDVYAELGALLVPLKTDAAAKVWVEIECGDGYTDLIFWQELNGIRSQPNPDPQVQFDITRTLKRLRQHWPGPLWQAATFTLQADDKFNLHVTKYQDA